jgi:hypothetical protein
MSQLVSGNSLYGYHRYIVHHYALFYSVHMSSTYMRVPLGFRERLATLADRKKSLTMSRLAAELHDSLTPLQGETVVAALDSAETLVNVSGLSRSQFNALLVLAHVNGLDDLREFFTGKQ